MAGFFNFMVGQKGFQKGYIPWNKGMEGYTNGGSFVKKAWDTRRRVATLL